METSQKFILFGIGLIIGGLLGIVGLVLHLFPDHKVKRTRMASIMCVLVGVAFIIVTMIRQP
jgi:hypothetical protein